MTLTLILLATLISSALGLIGGLLLLAKKGLSESVSLSLVSFAAGTLLATAFLDLLPESIELSQNPESVLPFVLAGVMIFFFIERYLLWFHHHHGKSDEETAPSTSLILIGDTFHNFLDGVLVAGSFLVNPVLGLTTSAAIVLHEIPQEISDFTVLLYGGMKKWRIVLYNLISALAAVLGGLMGYFFLSSLTSLIPYSLALGAGMFIYISCSDLIPEVHKSFRQKSALIQTLLFLGGVILIWVAKVYE